MKFRKVVCRSGRHVSPDGEVIIDSARLKRWVANWRLMNSRSIRVPVCWGHQNGPAGYPVDDDGDEEAAYQLSVSRYCAGYITDMGLTDDGEGLYVVADAPGIAGIENG